MKKRISIIYLTVALSVHFVSAQTITLQPDGIAGKDATINSYSLYNNSNFGNYTDFDAGSWTQGGTPFTWRSLIDFDLSGIPANAVIISAYLSFYYDPTSTHFGGVHSGQNASYLQRITQNWQENIVIWNNQPAVTTLSQVGIPATITNTQDLINIDVTTLVTDMKNNPSSSFGFMLLMQNENPYDDIVLASSDNSDSLKRPKLVITYCAALPGTTIELQPDAEKGKDAYISDWAPGNYQNMNFGTYPDYDAVAWTAGGTPYLSRGLLQFNLSVVPANAVLVSAQLSLYNNPTSQQGSHDALSGSNDSQLERITSDWDENLVTWNTQPPTTTQNAVNLAPSSSPNQDYLNIDVKNLVTDMINNPTTSFGFMYRLNTEQYYRRMVFASSDHPDPAKHPMLVLSYFLPTIVANGPTAFCAGGSVILSANSGAGLTYQWKRNNANISGAVMQSYTATASGNYTCVISSGCASYTSNAIAVVKNPVPAAMVTPGGTISFCAGQSALLTAAPSGNYSYQWKKNNSNINGATTITYTVTKKGNYKVTVVNNATGCLKTSNVVQVVVPCRENENSGTFANSPEENVFDVKVFPNPSSGSFNFEIQNAVTEKISINVFDMVGKLVLSENTNNSQFIIRNPELIRGVYTAVVTSGENKRVLKLVKTE